MFGQLLKLMLTIFNFLHQVGFVNSLKFSSNGQLLVAGVGQEHKLGRWWSIKPARNSIVVIKLPKHEPMDTNKLQNNSPV